MGDSSQVLPLCASPRGLFLHTGMVSYEKGLRSMQAAVSIFKKIRFPFLCDFLPVGPVIQGYDGLWFMFSIVPYFSVFAAFGLITGVVDQEPFKVVLFIVFFLGGVFTAHMLALYSVVYWYRDTPFQLIGAKTIFMIEVVPVMTLAVLRHLLEFNYGYLALSLGCTSYIYLFAHFLHVAYDIEGKDVLLGLLMQVLVYTVNGELSARALVSSFCFGLCLYRYMMYRAPEIPAHRKKELEQLPC